MATGYSGNMEFMDAENSILLPYELDKIRHVDRNDNSSGLWNSSMRWAYVDEDFLVTKMDDICRNPARYSYKRKNAAETMGKYSKENIKQLIAEWL